MTRIFIVQLGLARQKTLPTSPPESPVWISKMFSLLEITYAEPFPNKKINTVLVSFCYRGGSISSVWMGNPNHHHLDGQRCSFFDVKDPRRDVQLSMAEAS